LRNLICSLGVLFRHSNHHIYDVKTHFLTNFLGNKTEKKNVFQLFGLKHENLPLMTYISTISQIIMCHMKLIKRKSYLRNCANKFINDKLFVDFE